MIKRNKAEGRKKRPGPNHPADVSAGPSFSCLGWAEAPAARPDRILLHSVGPRPQPASDWALILPVSGRPASPSPGWAGPLS